MRSKVVGCLCFFILGVELHLAGVGDRQHAGGSVWLQIYLHAVIKRALTGRLQSGRSVHATMIRLFTTNFACGKAEHPLIFE